MKYFFSLLFLCLSLLANAQENADQKTSEPSFYTNEPSSNQMAGKYLQKYSRQYYLGTGLMVGGMVIYAMSVNTNSSGLATAGGLLALGGFVVQILSHHHVGRAGELLEQSSISQNLKIQASPEGLGLGLAYRF